jgi:hypothetical protein
MHHLGRTPAWSSWNLGITQPLPSSNHNVSLLDKTGKLFEKIRFTIVLSKVLGLGRFTITSFVSDSHRALNYNLHATLKGWTGNFV